MVGRKIHCRNHRCDKRCSRKRRKSAVIACLLDSKQNSLVSKMGLFQRITLILGTGSHPDWCSEKGAGPPPSPRRVITSHHVCRTRNIDLISLHWGDRPLCTAFGKCGASLRSPGTRGPYSHIMSWLCVWFCVCVCVCRMPNESHVSQCTHAAWWSHYFLQAPRALTEVGIHFLLPYFISLFGSFSCFRWLSKLSMRKTRMMSDAKDGWCFWVPWIFNSLVIIHLCLPHYYFYLFGTWV